MNSLSKTFAGLALALPLAGCNKPEQKPNIVFFLVDDMGWLDSSVAYGEESYPLNLRYHTPNMQRLAERGTLLTNAYVSPVSSPTRTTLMTGMHASHARITDFTTAVPGVPSDASHRPEALANDVLIRPDWNYNGISPTEGIPHTQHVTPMVRLLKDDGYYTIHVGKGHWAAAGTPGASPYNMGFCVNVAGQVAGKPTSYYGEENYGNVAGKWNVFTTQNMAEYYGTKTHLTEALTLEALKTLDYPIDNGIPFYLYMAHHGVHTPITPDPRFVQKYLDAGLDQGQANFASMIEGVDKSLGDIMDYLDRRGIADNTIIVFLSDNGGNSENTSKGGVLHTQNAPLREGKSSCYEGGIRVPMMVCWPERTAAGTRINTPVCAEDLFPTILEMAGIERYETVQQVDGRSLVRLLTDGSQAVGRAMRAGRIADQKAANAYVIDESVSGIDPEREVVTHFPHQWKPYPLEDIDYLSSLRKGDWKIVYRHRTQALELYNLREDIGERNDLAARNPAKLRELAALLGDKLRGWNASMPLIRSSGERIPYPDELLGCGD